MSSNSHFALMVHVLTLLAGSRAPLSSRRLAGSVNTNPVIIRQIVGQLREAGLVETVCGRAGGAVLTHAAEAVTLQQVYRLTREEPFFGLHASRPNPRCPVGRNIQGILMGLSEEMDRLVGEALDDITIADIASRVSQREAGGDVRGDSAGGSE